jgi:hypothetical protein
VARDTDGDTIKGQASCSHPVLNRHRRRRWPGLPRGGGGGCTATATIRTTPENGIHGAARRPRRRLLAASRLTGHSSAAAPGSRSSHSARRGSIVDAASASPAPSRWARPEDRSRWRARGEGGGGVRRLRVCQREFFSRTSAFRSSTCELANAPVLCS